jgi:hypothetical protein
MALAAAHASPAARDPSQTIAPADFARKLKARYVYDTDAQNLGANDPSAFDWRAPQRQPPPTRTRTSPGPPLRPPACLPGDAQRTQQLRGRAPTWHCVSELPARAASRRRAALGFAVSRHFRPAPVTHHMLGLLDAAPRPKKAAQRQRRKAQVGEPPGVALGPRGRGRAGIRVGAAAARTGTARCPRVSAPWLAGTPPSASRGCSAASGSQEADEDAPDPDATAALPTHPCSHPPTHPECRRGRAP